MSTKSNLWGLLAQYENPHAVYKACEQVRDAGYNDWDACTPFPVHGLDKAMGLKPSKLPWIVLSVGIAGSSFALFFEASGLAAAGCEPYRSLVPRLVEGWIEWAGDFISGTAAHRRTEAATMIAVIDGLLLLRQLAGPEVADRAARGLGVLGPRRRR